MKESLGEFCLLSACSVQRQWQIKMCITKLEFDSLCYRNMRSRLKPVSFIRDIVKDKIIGGALTREKQQYQKLVSAI